MNSKAAKKNDANRKGLGGTTGSKKDRQTGHQDAKSLSIQAEESHGKGRPRHKQKEFKDDSRT